MNQEMTGDNEKYDGAPAGPAFVMRLAMMSVGWVVLTGGDLSSWTIGVPTVLLTTALSMSLVRPGQSRWHPGALMRFVPFFVGRTISGGVDVARRAFAPSLPIDPALLPYPLRLPPQSAATIFFVNIISLLPGTLCAEIKGDELLVHVVDRESLFLEHLGELEALISDLFGEPLQKTRSAREEEG
ncbi:MAG: Na+/H+ antiporter subunit E [Bradymonadaceae bacterium]